MNQIIQILKTGKMVTKRAPAPMVRSGLLLFPSLVTSFLRAINMTIYLLIRGDCRSIQMQHPRLQITPIIFYIRYTSMLFLLVVWSSLAGATQTQASVLLADKGIALATIVIDANATQRMKETAQTLADYLQRSTGSKFAISDQPKLVPSSHAIVFLTVKNDNFSPSSSIPPIKDAFSIEFPNARSIVISGVSDIGVEFGVYDFLERFLGVRWLFPGDLGVHIPRRDRVEVPLRRINGVPRFQMRLISGLKTKEEYAWATKNRMHDAGIKFHHNLANLFPPEKYAVSHPEFYPVLNGKRFIPAPGVKTRWQPCFSAPGLADEAIKSIVEYFDKNPDAISFSIGINDAREVCNCSTCLARVGGRKNFLNCPDYSELYYSWANRVAEGVAKKYPGKFLGCLAYHDVAAPPVNFRLNSRIIPFLTSDRIKWVDWKHEGQEKSQNELWMSKAELIGWYDYIYGLTYKVPRVYFHKMANYFRYGADHGVKFYYAEAYPNWGEGPKLYLALRLLWNPYLDPDEILDDWYKSAVGAEAAPFLARYFQFWEGFWGERAPKEAWFKRRGIYLSFKKDDYLNQLTRNDLDYCRQLLTLVKAKTVTSEQGARADYFIQSFEKYEKNFIDFKNKTLPFSPANSR